MSVLHNWKWNEISTRLALWCVLLNNHIISKQPLCIMKWLFYLLIQGWNINITPWIKKYNGCNEIGFSNLIDFPLKSLFSFFKLLQKTHNTVQKSQTAPRQLWANDRQILIGLSRKEHFILNFFPLETPFCLKIIEFSISFIITNDSCHIKPEEKCHIRGCLRTADVLYWTRMTSCNPMHADARWNFLILQWVYSLFPKFSGGWHTKIEYKIKYYSSK